MASSSKLPKAQEEARRWCPGSLATWRWAVAISSYSAKGSLMAVVAMADVGREVEVEAVAVVGVIVIAAHVGPGLVGVEAIRSDGGAGVGADCQDGTHLLTARFEDRQKFRVLI
mmetsp:Transcript_133454/g.188530  ORF Transcript_133454/g.188530 Transcript_133454/m.188530 type:complete len:114 (-) Transcript_133454:140-481(-)